LIESILLLSVKLNPKKDNLVKQFTIQFATTITALILLSVNGQTEEVAEPAPASWVTSLVTDLTASQTSYSDSWVGGEAGSISWVSNLNGTVEKAFSPKFNFKSNSSSIIRANIDPKRRDKKMEQA